MSLADSAGTSTTLPVVQPSSTSSPLPDSPGYEIHAQGQSEVGELQDTVKTGKKQQHVLAYLPMEILERIFQLLPRGNLASFARVNPILSVVVRQMHNKDLFLSDRNLDAFLAMLETKSAEERAAFLANVRRCNLSYPNPQSLNTQQLRLMATLLRQIRPSALDVSYGSYGSTSELRNHNLLNSNNFDSLQHLSLHWYIDNNDSDKPLRSLLARCAKSLTSLKLEISALKPANVKAVDTPSFPLLEYLKYKAIIQPMWDPKAVSYWYVEDIVASAPNLGKLHLAGWYAGDRIAEGHMKLLRYFGPKLWHLKLTFVSYLEIAKTAQDVAHICPNISTVQIDAHYPGGVVECADLPELFPALIYLDLHKVTRQAVRQLANLLNENAYLPRLQSLEMLVRGYRDDIKDATKEISQLERVLEHRGIRFKIGTIF